MRIFIIFYIFSIASFAASPPPTELIVKIKSGQKIEQLTDVKNIQHLFLNIYILRSNNIEKVEKKLKNNPAVIYTERNHRSEKRELAIRHFKPTTALNHSFRLDFQFNDPLIEKVWSFHHVDHNGISVNDAYNEYGDDPATPVIVAVIDTGIDGEHEDLKDVVWVNQNEIPNNGIDDDHNGYIDDITGINTLERDKLGKATSNNFDKDSHGTHVSGIIGAKQNNGVGIAGIASHVKIMSIRTVPNTGDETDIDVAEAFVYAARNGAKIINCSFGKSINQGRQLIPDTLKYIEENFGVLVVVAAGNETSNIDSYPSYPASFTNENLLVVTSTTSSGGMSYFSNYGKKSVDVAAPGSNIYSTIPGNKYAFMSGTSMATPLTAGLAAEILSHNPHLTFIELKNIIIKSVTPIDGFEKRMVSGGRINLLAALNYSQI